ncbi:hypothetical protein PRK78_000791 [Emydomyces testavorans]|uniref:CST complex subunit Ten1 n=1 Tax=Emydomyces testavorans TaxID=2070801 RepID=A0AAF0IG79_9EURO|nr:hypothetical protein PRK78_000791 [Emydomyces testavorans]
MNQQVPGPLPTRLVFLSEVSSLPEGSKVRFLGCISKYTIATGILNLEHKYSASLSDQKCFDAISEATIDVDINLLLDSLSHADIDVGNWVNVLGYVRRSYPVSRLCFQAETPNKADLDPTVYVEAVMIIPAGAIRLGEYERVLSESREVERRLKTSG